MKKILGDKFYIILFNVEEFYLLFLDVLKGKILIKVKKLFLNCFGVEGDVIDEDEGVEMFQRVGKENVEQFNNVFVKRFQFCKELFELVSICKFVQFKEFQVLFQVQKYWEVCLFNEVFVSKYVNENLGDFVNYNKRFFVRVFFSLMRIDFSNMNF